MTGRKLRKGALESFGKAPERHYFPGDMDQIASYFRHRQEAERDAFYIDDITWNDLSLEDAYKRINLGSSTSGEQYLYYMMRTPTQKDADYQERESAVAMMEGQPELRKKLHAILLRLGRKRDINPNEVFNPSQNGILNLILSILLFVGLTGCIVATAVSTQAYAYIPIFMIVNMIYHTTALKKLEGEFPTVNYIVGMLRATDRVQKIGSSDVDAAFQKAYQSSGRMKAVKRIGSISFAANSELLTLLNHVFLIDLICFEFVKNRFGRHQQDIFAIHEALGKIDACIAVASYRQTLGIQCDPVIDFSKDAAPRISCGDAVHPLLEDPVPNSIVTEKCVLLTGSNASGKSTFIKSVALAAIFSQSLCTAPCREYRATSFAVMSSMAVSDNILEGESYFVSEIKSLKRILDAAGRGTRILAVIDEVLRGTNTIERVAASSELLAYISQKPNVLCFAATHDLELCSLLQRQYAQFHFEETVEGDGLWFDYLLKPGAAATRNAIKLLSVMGYDEQIVDKANRRAQHFVDSGRWGW